MFKLTSAETVMVSFVDNTSSSRQVPLPEATVLADRVPTTNHMAKVGLDVFSGPASAWV